MGIRKNVQGITWKMVVEIHPRLLYADAARMKGMRFMLDMKSASKQLTFYVFLQECAENNNHVCQQYAISLLKHIDSLENFPRQNYDKKTIEIALRKSMGKKYDECLINYLWKEYMDYKKRRQFFNKYFP